MAAGMRLVPNGTASAAQAAAFDIQLTQSALHYLHDAHFGRIDPRRVGFELAAPRAPFDSTAVLLDMSGADAGADAGAVHAGPVHAVADIAASVEPQFYHYKLLKNALSQYRALARDPPPLLTAPAHPIKVGNPYAQAPALRQTLIRLGDLSPDSAPSADPLTFDAALSAGIRRFQARHGLRIDGVLDSATSRALAVPLAARVRQIELTLERWRWVPEFSAPPVIVNIPQFRLFAFNSLQDQKVGGAANGRDRRPGVPAGSYPGLRGGYDIGGFSPLLAGAGQHRKKGNASEARTAARLFAGPTPGHRIGQRRDIPPVGALERDGACAARRPPEAETATRPGQCPRAGEILAAEPLRRISPFHSHTRVVSRSRCARSVMAASA